MGGVAQGGPTSYSCGGYAFFGAGGQGFFPPRLMGDDLVARVCVL